MAAGHLITRKREIEKKYSKLNHPVVGAINRVVSRNASAVLRAYFAAMQTDVSSVLVQRGGYAREAVAYVNTFVGIDRKLNAY